MIGDGKEDSVEDVAVHIEDNPECRISCKGLLISADVLRSGGWIDDHSHNGAREVVAYIPLWKYTFDSYIAEIRKLYKGNSVREAQRASAEGFFCQHFNRRQWLPDIYDINTSMALRSGRPMSGHYLRSVQEMGGAPTRPYPPDVPTCVHHIQTNFGVFLPAPGHTQGTVKTDARLVGYIMVNRYGDFGIYSLIMGHGDFLKKNVMALLHLYVMKDLLAPDGELHNGLRHLMYHRFITSNKGLTFWKKKFAFRPARLIADHDLTNERSSA